MSQSDGELLFATVLAQPDDDAPRLVYADWLEENGQPERAEFIRVQVELARMDEAGEGIIDEQEGHTCVEHPCWVCEEVDRYTSLRRRAIWLINDHRQWFRIPGFGEFVGFGENELLCWWPAEDSRGDSSRIEGTPTRGFVSNVSLDWPTWVQHAPAILESCKFLKEVNLSRMPMIERFHNDRRRSAYVILFAGCAQPAVVSHIEMLARNPKFGMQVSQILSKIWPKVSFIETIQSNTANYYTWLGTTNDEVSRHIGSQPDRSDLAIQVLPRDGQICDIHIVGHESDN